MVSQLAWIIYETILVMGIGTYCENMYLIYDIYISILTFEIDELITNL